MLLVCVYGMFASECTLNLCTLIAAKTSMLCPACVRNKQTSTQKSPFSVRPKKWNVFTGLKTHETTESFIATWYPPVVDFCCHHNSLPPHQLTLPELQTHHKKTLHLAHLHIHLPALQDGNKSQTHSAWQLLPKQSVAYLGILCGYGISTNMLQRSNRSNDDHQLYCRKMC